MTDNLLVMSSYRGSMVDDLFVMSGYWSSMVDDLFMVSRNLMHWRRVSDHLLVMSRYVMNWGSMVNSLLMVNNWLMVSGDVLSGGTMMSVLRSSLVNKGSVLLNEVVELLSKFMGVWVRDVVGNVYIASSELSGANEAFKSVDVLLEDVLSAFEFVKSGLDESVLLNFFVVMVQVRSINTESLEIVVEMSVLLSQNSDLILHFLNSMMELFVVNLEGLLRESLCRVDWFVVDGVDLNLLLEVFHMFSRLLVNDSDWYIDSLNNLVLNNNLLDDLNLSFDDNIVVYCGFNFLFNVLSLLDLLDDLNLDGLLDGDGDLHDNLNRDFNLDDVLILVSSAGWHMDRKILMLGHRSVLDNVVLDVLGLDSGRDFNWLSNSNLSVSGMYLPKWDSGNKGDVDVFLFSVDCESIDGYRVSDTVLFVVMVEGSDFILISHSIRNFLDYGVGRLNSLDDFVVRVTSNFILDMVALHYGSLDMNLSYVVLLIVLERWDFVFYKDDCSYGLSLEILVEFVDWYVNNVSDEVDLVLGYFDNLLLGVESNVSFEYLVDMVVSLKVLKLSDVNLNNSFLTGGLAV